MSNSVSHRQPGGGHIQLWTQTWRRPGLWKGRQTQNPQPVRNEPTVCDALVPVSKSDDRISLPSNVSMYMQMILMFPIVRKSTLVMRTVHSRSTARCCSCLRFPVWLYYQCMLKNKTKNSTFTEKHKVRTNFFKVKCVFFIVLKNVNMVSKLYAAWNVLNTQPTFTLLR